MAKLKNGFYWGYFNSWKDKDKIIKNATICELDGWRWLVPGNDASCTYNEFKPIHPSPLQFQNYHKQQA